MTSAPPLPSLAAIWDSPVDQVQVVYQMEGEIAPDGTVANHWSFLLATGNGTNESARFNLSSATAKEVATLVVKPAKLSATPRKIRDPVAKARSKKFTPQAAYDLVAREGKLKYRMSESGKGCRHWTHELLLLFVRGRWLDKSRVDEIWEVMQSQYSLRADPFISEVEEGRFEP